MRMKSYLPDPTGFVRDAPHSRYTAVQNSSVWLRLQHKISQRWVFELIPLAAKTGQCLATALLLQVEEVLGALVAGSNGKTSAALVAGNSGKTSAAGLPLDAPREVTFLHLVVGDGVASNLNCCRRLLSYMTTTRRPCKLRYRMVALRCVSHQVNLLMVTATAGQGGGRHDILEQSELLANVSRLHKHVLPEASELLLHRLRGYLIRTTVFTDGAPDPAITQQLQGMQGLYGADVLSDELLQCRPHGLASTECYLLPCGPLSAEERLRDMIETFRKALLQPEERPVVTRFWKFGLCCYQLLRYILLRIPIQELFHVGERRPGQTGLRMRRVAAYLRDVEAPQELREVCLAARLVLHAQSLVSKKPAADEKPMIVRLVSGELQRRTGGLLSSMLRSLASGSDPDINLPRAVERLLATYVHLCIRFHQYKLFPFRLCNMVQQWNPEGYMLAAMRFLEAQPDVLDLGFSFPLQREALQKGTAQAALDYLVGPEVQQECRPWFRIPHSSTHACCFLWVGVLF